MKNLSDINIEKSRSGVYKDNPENRRLHRVGQRYGSPAREEDSASKPLTRRNAESKKPSGKKETKKERIASGKKTLSAFLKKIGINIGEGSVAHHTRSDGADGLYYASGGHVPVRATYYPGEDKVIFAYPNVRSQFAGSPSDSKFMEVVRGLIEDRDKNNPVKGLDKMSVEELQRNIQETKDAIEAHGNRKELFEQYQMGEGQERDDRWTSIQERLERKLDGLQKEYNKRESSAKKIDEGVRASEERRNLEETKKTNEKVNEAIKQSERDGKFSRVNLPDIPNAHKVNLTKYLSAKRKKAVDDAWEKAKFDSLTREKAGVFQEGYNKLREQFNNNFDDMSKSERAELLYKILKMKNAMERK